MGKDYVLFGDQSKLTKYSRDQVANPKYGHPPDIVAFPKTAEQISKILHLANREMIPVTPRGGGSGLSGGAVPLYGGISLVFDRMNEIREIDPTNLVAVVEPGVVTKELDRRLQQSGLFFAGYPLSEEICTVGGNVAENAGGGRAVKYGVTARYVLGLEVVLPTGDTITVGGKRYKDVTGYDLIHLLTGSEGTLGIFSEITLRLLPRPRERALLKARFSGDTANTVAARVVPGLLIHPSIQPSAIEFIDEVSMRITEEFVNGSSNGNTGALLVVEVDGDDSSHVERRISEAAKLCESAGAEVQQAVSDEEQENVWKIRKQIPWALKKLNPRLTAEDISVPVGSLGAVLENVRELESKYKISIPCFGHAADGNIHASPMKSQEIPDGEWDEVLRALLVELYDLTYAAGGTISGEHGIGHKRKPYLHQVMDSGHIELLKRVKKSFDPNNILNPGKIFDLP